MYFSSVTLKNFGSFRDRRFEFRQHDINWVVGANGSGKTQLVGAIVATLVGRAAIEINADGEGPASVEIYIHEGKQAEIARLDVYEEPSGQIQIDKGQGLLAVAILAQLATADGQQLYVREHDPIREPVDLAALRRSIPASLQEHPQFRRALQAAEAGQHRISSGQRSLLMLMIQCVERLRAAVKIPLIVDMMSMPWARDGWEFALALLREVANVAQVIVVGSLAHDHEDWGGGILVVKDDQSRASLAYFKESYVRARPQLRRIAASRWNQGSRFARDESRTCEFKEVQGANAIGSIKNTVDEYVVAFLNAGRQQEGAIFWGIRDGDHAIVGVPLNARERDVLRREVVGQLLKISPSLAPSQYQIDMHAVTDGGKPINDLFVVEVRVPAVRGMLLFATGGNEVFVKTDAGKKKLTPLELQREVLLRAGVDWGN